MLVLARFSNAGTRSRATVPHGTQTKFERVGDQPNYRRFRRLAVPATRAWAGDPQERHHEDCRATAWRCNCPGESSLSESRGNQRNKAVRCSAEGPECRGVDGFGGKSRNHADDTDRANGSGLLDLHHISTGAEVPFLVPKEARRSATARLLQGPG